MFGLEALGDPCLAVDGRERQKGDVDFLCTGQLGNVPTCSVAWQVVVVL